MATSSTAAIASMVAAAAAKSGDSSSSGLLSGLVSGLWPHINEAVCKEVKASVEPSFADLPGPLKTLTFTELDLGMVPIRIDNVLIHDKERDALQFDFDVVWDGDCNIQLKANYLGSFGVQKIKFSGRLSVVLSPLLNTIPVVSAAQICFINPPTFELDFLGLADLADCSLVDSKIRGVISDVLDSILVLPNRLYIKVDPANRFLDTYKPPVGVARVTVERATGFDGGYFSDSDDVYCTVKLGSSPLWKTSTKNNCTSPVWNETSDFLLYDHDQILTIRAWDEDTGSDDALGTARVTVREVLLAGKTVTLNLDKNAKVTLRCEICPLSPSNLDSLESNKDENLLSGLITVLVIGAEDIPLKKAEAKTFVKVKYGDKTEFVTGTVKHAPGVDALDPIYDCAFQIPLGPDACNKKESLELILMNGKDTVLGTTTVSHDAMMVASETGITGQRKIGDGGASLEFRVTLSGVLEPTDADTLAKDGISKLDLTASSNHPDRAKGTVRLSILKGWGFEVEKRKHRLIKRRDVPDVYCNITFGSSPKVWRTKTIRNNLTPEWNEAADYLFLDHGQIINIEVFDEDKRRDKDDELGGARINVGKLLVAGGPTDVELFEAGKPSGKYISMRCDFVKP